MRFFGFREVLKKKKAAEATSELEAALADNQKKLNEKLGFIDNYGQRRSEMLISGSSVAEIRSFYDDYQNALIEREQAEAACAELTDIIERARSTAEHKRLAAQLDKDASAIEERAKHLDGAIASLASAYNALLSAIPADNGVILDAGTRERPATPEDIARALFAAKLYAAVPGAFELATPRMGGPRPACVERILNVFTLRDGALSRFNAGLVGEECDPSEVTAGNVIVGPLRKKASVIRSQVEALDGGTAQ